ncbi:MAG: hypothetical protein EOM20_13750, partial [Spartobacteria bacterium]|nr:hypothetical protein [Spartobacteria bacterium]
MNILLVASFLVVIWLPMALMIVRPSGDPSEAGPEKRALGTFPTLEWNREAWRLFPRHVDVWLQDHFGLRNQLIHLHNWMSYFWFNVSPSPKVIVG